MRCRALAAAFFASLALSLFSLSTSIALAAPAASGPEVGAEAPAFEAKDDAGNTWKSADHYGKKIVVVYFYPAAMTPGCTKQACGFRDDMKTLTEQGVVVVAVSGDEVSNLKIFKKAHDLNFPLLSDFDGSVAKKFGVPTTPGAKEVKIKLDGIEQILKRGVTEARWTYVVGLDGKIALKNTTVKAAEDSKAILALVNKLKK